MQGVSATQLRDALAAEAEIRPFMTHQDFVNFVLAQYVVPRQLRLKGPLNGRAMQYSAVQQLYITVLPVMH
jgi:hypothetical protein